MTEQSQLEALSRWEGWRLGTVTKRQSEILGCTMDTPAWSPPTGFLHEESDIDLPAYDLNDMARVRTKLSRNELRNYVANLDEICHAAALIPVRLNLQDARDAAFRIVDATAAQHREAALKALGLWKES